LPTSRCDIGHIKLLCVAPRHVACWENHLTSRTQTLGQFRARLIFSNRSLKFVLGLAVGVALSAMSGARSENWPNSPIRVIVPQSAGNAADIVPRIVFEQMKSQLGQPIIIENRPGANGTIGAGIAAQAQPDGYTLLTTSSAYTIAPATFASLPYDPVKDFVGITSLGNLPSVLVIAPSKGVRTLQQLVDFAKVKPITFGSTGIGGPVYLTMERLRQAANFEARTIPFKGTPQGLIEVMAGRVDVYYSPLLAALPFIQNDQLLPLAVSSEKRTSALPNVPTTLEAGYPNSNYSFWIGVFAPVKTPGLIIDKLNTEISKALQVPAVQEKLEKIGVQLMPMSIERFNAFVREELAANAALAKAAGITRQ
jgi:tripartite-type tricarboxylate transporter receptor subunit TctC